MRMTSSSTLLGIVLAVSIFGAGVVTDRLTNVNITNFPLDEQGNLKITMAEKPLQKYKNAVEIKALDHSSHQYGGNEYGVFFYPVNLTLPFAFTPNEKSLNITDVWVAVGIIIWDYTDWKLDVMINNGTSVTSSVQWCYLTSINRFTIHIEDPSIYNSIVNGINTLTVASRRWVDGRWDLGWCTAYEASIFIEYEYQA